MNLKPDTLKFHGSIKNTELWLQEANENYNTIPENEYELAKKIDVMRSRLVIIAEIYGYRSSQTLIYSQYLDIYIVKYQKLIKNSFNE